MMREIYFLCCCLLSMQLVAQTSEHKNGLTYKFVVTDYNTLDPIFQNRNNSDRILHPEEINYAGEIGFFRNINKSLNLGIPLRIGSIDAHHRIFEGNDTLEIRKRNELFFSTDVVAMYKFNNDYLLKEKSIVAPYIVLGVSGLYLSQQAGNFDFQIPMGIGVNVKLNKFLYLQLQFEYRKSLVLQKDNFAITGGISWLLDFKRKGE